MKPNFNGSRRRCADCNHFELEHKGTLTFKDIRQEIASDWHPTGCRAVDKPSRATTMRALKDGDLVSRYWRPCTCQEFRPKVRGRRSAWADPVGPTYEQLTVIYDDNDGAE